MTMQDTQGGRAAARRAARGKGAPGRSRGANRRRQKPHQRLKRVLMGVGAFVILVAALGIAWIYQLNGNIKHSALDTGAAQKGKVIPGVLNILVIGSDSRLSASDSSLGGSDNSLPHADVEMLVHVSADHQNATVMSIPRDTDIAIPACTQNGKTYTFPAHSQITNSLNYGPGCTVSAVNSLTGININHFMMVDFSGVVSMSDAVGGVQVCVNNNVYDPGSHLKLSAGTHTLVGAGALAFLRSRHAFGGASDIDRTAAQHIFLSDLIRRMKSANTLANPANVFNLAEAASKAFQVDDGLAGVTNLASLANTLGGIPTDRITFTTMPVAQDPYNPNAWLVPGAGAQDLFSAIANDQSLTPSSSPTSAKPSAGPSAKPSSAAAPTVNPASIPIHVLNGTTTTGLAGNVATELNNKGYTDTVTGDGPSVSSSQVEYSTSDPIYKEEAQQVAGALGLPSSSLSPTSGLTSIHVIIGPDLKTGSGGPSTKPSANLASATAAALAQNAADTKDSCAKTTSFPIEALPPSAAAYDGLTVEQAYAKATRAGIPDSDK
jgi:LCP family protein required for cell wall assembly